MIDTRLQPAPGIRPKEGTAESPRAPGHGCSKLGGRRDQQNSRPRQAKKIRSAAPISGITAELKTPAEIAVREVTAGGSRQQAESRRLTAKVAAVEVTAAEYRLGLRYVEG